MIAHGDAFHEAARLLFGGIYPPAMRGRVDLSTLKWRHHGLGMLQAELSETFRIHVWHPELRTMLVSDFADGSSFRDVHDHRFDLMSTVLVGEVTDVPFYVLEWLDSFRWPEGGSRVRKTQSWEIPHAKIQAEPGASHHCLGLVGACPENEDGWPVYKAGETYRIRRRAFHTTRVSALAVTVVHRANFDERPARVLGTEEEVKKSGIVPPDAPGWGDRRAFVVQEATCALRGLL